MLLQGVCFVTAHLCPSTISLPRLFIRFCASHPVSVVLQGNFLPVTRHTPPFPFLPVTAELAAWVQANVFRLEERCSLSGSSGPLRLTVPAVWGQLQTSALCPAWPETSSSLGSPANEPLRPIRHVACLLIIDF